MPEAALQLGLHHRRQMLDHISHCLPEEACGLVGGRENWVKIVIPVTNELHSPVRFRMDSNEQIRALLWLEKHHLELLAIYHSHPTGPGHPSATDLAEYAYPEAISIVWSAGQSGWQASGYRITPNGFLEIPLEWVDTSHEASDEGFLYPKE